MGTQALPTDDSELYSLAHDNEPKSHLQSPCRRKRKSSFNLNRFNKALHTEALVAICSPLRDLGAQRAVSFAYLNDHVRLLKYTCTRALTFVHISSLVASVFWGYLHGDAYCMTNRIYYRSSMQIEKSQPEGKRIKPETRFTSFPALSVDPRVGICRSASESDVRLFFLPMTLKNIIYHSSFLSFLTFFVA